MNLRERLVDAWMLSTLLASIPFQVTLGFAAMLWMEAEKWRRSL